VRAEFAVQIEMGSFVEQIQVVSGEERNIMGHQARPRFIGRFRGLSRNGSLRLNAQVVILSCDIHRFRGASWMIT
jgi:hypothetical protein